MDDDLTAGALHLVETLKFLHVVRAIGWTDPLKLDLSPYREDRTAAVRESIETLRRLEERASQIDAQELADAQGRHDAMAVQSIMRKTLLG